MSIRTSIYRRCIPAALSATVAAGAFTAPRDAEAAIGTDIVMDLALNLVGMGIAELIGGDDSVMISQESLEAIGDIVDASISQAFLDHYMATANATITQAELYVCSDTEDPPTCASQAETVFYAVDLAASYLEMTDLPGVSYYGMMTAMGIAFLKEWRAQEVAAGDLSQADLIDGHLESKTLEAEYLRSMRDEWFAAENDHRDEFENQHGPFPDLITGYELPIGNPVPMFNPMLGHFYFYDMNGQRQEFEFNTGHPPGCPECADPGARDAAHEEAVAAYEQMYVDARNDVLGSNFQKLVDEIEFVGTGESIDYTSTELFCEMYDGEQIRMRSQYGFYFNAGLKGGVTNPKPNTVFDVDCINGDSQIRFTDKDGEYLRVMQSNTLDFGGTAAGEANRWTAWMQEDGTWALRSWLDTYIDAGELLWGIDGWWWMRDFVYDSTLFTIDVV